MRMKSFLFVGIIALAGACQSGSDYYPPSAIVGGTAKIVAVEAWSDDRKTLLADLSARYSGTLTVDAGQQVSGSVTVDGAESAVAGVVQQEGSSLTFEVSNLPPLRLIVLYDNGDLDHYTLVGSYLAHADVTGDSIPESYRLYYRMEK